MIKVNQLAFGYQHTEVFENLSFSLERGEVVSLLGRSGCGKTTVLRCVSGLLQPWSGSVEIEGLPPKAAIAANKIGIMFQSDGLLEWRTVAENVRLPFELGRADMSSTGGNGIAEALALVGLMTHHDRYPHELSGGMRQRVALARALAPRPSIILLDEPFSALDLITREEIMIELHSIIKKAETPSLVVTHHVEEAVFISDRILIMGGEPASIQREITPDIGSERGVSLLSSPQFLKAVANVKDALRKSMGWTI